MRTPIQELPLNRALLAQRSRAPRALDAARTWACLQCALLACSFPGTDRSGRSAAPATPPAAVGQTSATPRPESANSAPPTAPDATTAAGTARPGPGPGEGARQAAALHDPDATTDEQAFTGELLGKLGYEPFLFLMAGGGVRLSFTGGITGVFLQLGAGIPGAGSTWYFSTTPALRGTEVNVGGVGRSPVHGSRILAPVPGVGAVVYGTRSGFGAGGDYPPLAPVRVSAGVHIKHPATRPLGEQLNRIVVPLTDFIDAVVRRAGTAVAALKPGGRGATDGDAAALIEAVLQDAAAGALCAEGGQALLDPEAARAHSELLQPGDGREILRLQCFRAEHQGASVFLQAEMLPTGARRFRRLPVELFDGASLQQAFLLDGITDQAPETGELATWDQVRAEADCGVYYRHRIDAGRGRLVLVEQRAKDLCDQQPTSPTAYPLVYPAADSPAP